MKNSQIYTKKEIKKAKKYAYNFIYSDSNLKICRPFSRSFKFDGRTKIGNLANRFVLELQKNENLELAKNKRISRRKNKKYIFKSILKNPIVIDFINNNPTNILKDRLIFGSRNHWAKTEKDIKILEILSKKLTKKTA
jgi:hypothetical protein